MNIDTSVNAGLSIDGSTDASINIGRSTNIHTNTDMNVRKDCIASSKQILIPAVVLITISALTLLLILFQ